MATATAIVASQALISASFQIVKQAIAQGFFPRWGSMLRLLFTHGTFEYGSHSSAWHLQPNGRDPHLTYLLPNLSLLTLYCSTVGPLIAPEANCRIVHEPSLVKAWGAAGQSP